MKPPKAPELAAESTRKWWSSPGIVYFVAAGNPISAIKIGMAAQTGKNSLQSAVHRRLSQIQTSNHERVELIGLCYFTDSDYPTRDAEIYERELHLKFAHLQRFKAGTRGAEWFNATSELLSEVAGVSTKPEQLDVPRYYAELSENNA